METRLNIEIESPANPLLKKLGRNEPITVDERTTVARYIVTMLKRVPRGRARAESLVGPSIESTFADLQADAERAALAGEITSEALGMIQRGLAQQKKIYEVELPEQALAAVRDPMPGDRLTAVVSNMMWRVIIAPAGEAFITSDNPAYFHEGYGFGDERAELRFPLSPTHALHATWYKGPGGDLSFHNTTRDWVREFNRAQASNATTLLFASRYAPWLRTLLERRRPYLFRLTWFLTSTAT